MRRRDDARALPVRAQAVEQNARDARLQRQEGEAEERVHDLLNALRRHVEIHLLHVRVLLRGTVEVGFGDIGEGAVLLRLKDGDDVLRAALIERNDDAGLPGIAVVDRGLAPVGRDHVDPNCAVIDEVHAAVADLVEIDVLPRAELAQRAVAREALLLTGGELIPKREKPGIVAAEALRRAAALVGKNLFGAVHGVPSCVM